jgi:hypothetical protein
MTRARKKNVMRPTGAPDTARRPSRLWLIFWIGVAALALWFRINLITSEGRGVTPAIAGRLYAIFTLGLVTGPQPPPVFAGMTYPGDHDDFVRWGIQATDRGVLSLYDEKPAPRDLRVWDKQKRLWSPTPQKRGFNRLCNYPPLSAYLLYGSGLAFRALSTEPVAAVRQTGLLLENGELLPVGVRTHGNLVEAVYPERGAWRDEQGEHQLGNPGGASLDGRLINTPASLGTFLSWSIVGDVLVAAGCAAVVSLFRRGWAARITFLLALALPPLWWDSVVWGQMDSVLLAPAVWMLYFMLRERWLLAGTLWGIAFGLKPQAVLFIPLWGLALFTARSYWRVLAGGGLAAAVFFLIGLPFTLHGGLTWLDESYRKNLFGLYAELTTLKAFNLWYLHLLLTDSLDAQARFLGLTCASWGKLLLLLGLLAGFLYALRYWRHDRRALIVWTLVSLLLFMMVPTAVHERYLILVLPFLGIATALGRRFWPALLLLVFVMVGQLSWPLWLGTVRGHWPDARALAVRELDQRIGGQPISPEQKKRVLDQVLAAKYASYREQLAQTASREWIFTLCALAGTAGILAACVTWKPQPPPTAAPLRTGHRPALRASRPG